MYRFAALLAAVLAVPEKAAPLDTMWYSPQELLPALATRDGIRWALPETLAGRAWVGGDVSCKAALDDACKQWKMSWTEANGIVVVHRGDDAALKSWTTTLAARGPAAAEAAWELGWLRDARAVPVLAEALADKDPAVALAAAQALDTLLTDIPLGRDERVDPMLPGRVSLAAAFPPRGDLLPLLDSPYPPVRAAAARVLLGQGGKAAEAARTKTADDRSGAVQQVRQQLLFTPSKDRPKKVPLSPPPKDAEAVKAACAKMLEELPGLEKQSGWESMTRRAETLAAWSRAGHDEATEALIELTGTKLQAGWYPGIVQKNLATSGGDRVRAKLKEIMPKAARDYIVRGLEESYYGGELVALTGPYLAEPTVCYVTCRKGGREAIDMLLPLAEKGNLAPSDGYTQANVAAIDALGVIGGSRAIAVLRKTLEKDEKQSATTAFRSAKALGRIGTAEALEVLLSAADSPALLRRHAAVLFLGRIGGPKAEAKLRDILGKDGPRLVKAAAADGLEQIGTKDALAAAAAFRKADAGPPPLVYQPRNPRFGPDFPVNEWVNLKITVLAQGWGEMGWNHDPANHLFFRQGGCTGPYNNEVTVFDLGTEQFVQRRPIELMAGWGDGRPGNGCSVGRTWDPWLKAAWIRHGIGGTGNQLGMVDYFARTPAARFAAYDLATDRFRAAAYHEATYGEPATRLACAWKPGLVLPVKFTHPNHKTKDFWALDVKAADPFADAAWKNLTNADGDYPRNYPGSAYTIAAVDQDAGLLVLYLPPFDTRPAETWSYDPAKNVWKEMKPKVQPPGVPGAGLVYDPFHKVLLFQSGKKATQFGGPDDSVTWTYDVRTNTWTDLTAKNGPGSPWVGAMDFDAEHNVFVLFNFKDKQVWAYRHKAVKPGTQTE
jgi:HEAT repeat protein